jgi:chorismate mutase
MLDKWRSEIDEIDHAMIELLHRRFQLSEAIGQYKLTQGFPIQNTLREAEQLEKWSSDLGSDSNKPYIINILKTIVKISRKRQNDIRKGESTYENSIL